MLKFILLLPLVLFPSSVFANDSILDIWKNNQAVDLLRQEKKTEAYEEFSKILSDRPFHPLYQFNMGSSFLSVEEKAKAKKMYQEILKIEKLPAPLLFAVYYNLGALNASDNELDLALDFYQKALSVNPESKEVKTNIELLFQQKQGKGKGGGKNKNKDQENNKEKGEEEQPQEPQEFQNQPKQFNSKDMSKSDVKKILEELKKQEQRIRAKHERNGKKEAANEKSW